MRRGSVGRTGAQPPGGCPPRAAVPRPPRGLTACGAPRPASCPSPSRSCWDSATASGTWRRGWSPAPPAAPIPAGCGDRPRPWGRRAPLPACPGRTEPPRSRPPCPPPSAPSAAPRRAPTTAAGSAPSPDSAPRRGCSRPGSDPGARSRRGWRRGRRSRTAEGGWRGKCAPRAACLPAALLGRGGTALREGRGAALPSEPSASGCRSQRPSHACDDPLCSPRGARAGRRPLPGTRGCAAGKSAGSGAPVGRAAARCCGQWMLLRRSPGAVPRARQGARLARRDGAWLPRLLLQVPGLLAPSSRNGPLVSGPHGSFPWLRLAQPGEASMSCLAEPLPAPGSGYSPEEVERRSYGRAAAALQRRGACSETHGAVLTHPQAPCSAAPPLIPCG